MLREAIYREKVERGKEVKGKRGSFSYYMHRRTDRGKNMRGSENFKRNGR